MRPWLLPAVYERLRTGRGEFLAELRPAIPSSCASAASTTTATTTRSPQARRLRPPRAADLLATTAATCSSSRSATRARTCTRSSARRTPTRTTPRAPSPPRSSCATLDGVTAARDISDRDHPRPPAQRHLRPRDAPDVHCLGDAVNLAARLMSKAPPGQVYVAQPSRDAAGDAFAWEALPPLDGEGQGRARPGLRARRREAARAAAAPALRARARRPQRRARAPCRPRSTPRSKGAGSIVGISAEAGMGKSRLVAEFVRSAPRRRRPRRLRRVPGVRHEHRATSSGARSGARLLGVDDDAATRRGAARRARGAARRDRPRARARAPLLDTVLGRPDPRQRAHRRASTRSCARRRWRTCCRVPAGAGGRASRWCSCSRTATGSTRCRAICSRCSSAPSRRCRCCSCSPTGPSGAHRAAGSGSSAAALRRDRADRARARRAELLIRSKLGAALRRRRGRARRALVELVTARAQGNPFYVEELLNYLHGQALDPQRRGALRGLELPESLHSLILSRIDTLDESPRRTLKVASVVGRSFLRPDAARRLPGARLDRRRRGAPRRTLRGARPRRPRPGGRGPTSSSTSSRRRSPTRACRSRSARSSTSASATYIEETEADAIEHQLDLLAHHYWHSDNVAKKREYLRARRRGRAGEYANAAAIDYFERLAPLVGERRAGRRAAEARRGARARRATGSAPRRSSARRSTSRSGSATTAPARWCETALAEIARKQGRYDEAHALLDRAAATLRDASTTTRASARCCTSRARSRAQRGDYEQAGRAGTRRAWRSASGSATGRHGGLLSNLGIVAEYDGDYDASGSFHERALAILTRARRPLGDRATPRPTSA